MMSIQSTRIFNSIRICRKNSGSRVFLYFQPQKAFFSNIRDEKKDEIIFHKTGVLKKIQSSVVLSKLSDNLSLDVKPFLGKQTKSNQTYYFVADEDVARKIVSKMINYLNDEKSLIVEHNPGLGLITHFLIQSKIKSFNVLEDPDLSMTPFKNLYNNNSTIITLCKANLLKSYVEFRNTLLNLTELGMKSSKIIKIIGVIPLQIHFSRYMYFFLEEFHRYAINQIELYAVTSETVVTNFKKFECSKGKFSTFCIENNFFNLELLAEFPCTAFLPFVNEKMYLVRMTGRKKCFEKIGEKNLNLYLNFLRVLERRRKNYVIQTLETWMPDCGPLLISKGLSCTTRVIDLQAEETVDLFLICKTWKTFQNFINLQSYFKHKWVKPFD